MLIYKSTLQSDTLDIKKIKLPFESIKEAKEHIFKLDIQYDRPCMWYQTDLHDDEFEGKDFLIIAIGTGHPRDDSLNKDNYLGTLVLMGGMLVLHYYIIENRIL